MSSFSPKTCLADQWTAEASPVVVDAVARADMNSEHAGPDDLLK